MSWTYDATKFADATVSGQYPPATVGGRMQIRFLIQDVQTSRQLLQDEEIDWAQTIEANVYMSAALCCEVLVARAGSVKSKRAADLQVEYDVDFYRGLAAQLRAKGMSAQTPVIGGISISDKTVQQQDSDAVQPRMFTGELDNPLADQPAPGSSPSGFPMVP